MVPFLLQMTTKSSTVTLLVPLAKMCFVKSKEVNMPHECMASYQIQNTKY